jgi:putative flippase GtrA
VIALRQVAPYASIAGTCAALNVAVLIGGDRIGLSYVISATVSFALCVVIGYLLHCRFTFSADFGLVGFQRYVAAMALNYPLSMLSLFLLHDALGLAMEVASVASVLMLSLYNFGASRWAIAAGRSALPREKYTRR